ncbi:MAG: hypothetical protein FJY95_18240 [Candidatus Handelsmanbacteria bacterium]|nr:hypothetical protein [Candidatus Handelsmanbacteria bacterium]
MDKDAGSRGYIDRFDLACWVGAVFFLVLFCGSMLHHTRGQLSLPLDDSFIYFQYARQLAEGHFLRYNSGDPPTTGATSLLYLLLLAPGHWLGFHGMYLAVYALLLGLGCLGASLWLVRRVGVSLGDEESGKGAALLLLLCGPLLWGFFSGMEIGLFTGAVLLTLYLFIREEPTGRFRLTPWAAALLVLARPEGAGLAACLVGLWGLRALKYRQWKCLWVCAPPLLVFLAQGLLYLGLTGSFSSAGMEAKWRFSAPHTSAPEEFRRTLQAWTGFFKGVLAGSLGPQTSARLLAYDGNARQIFFGPFFLLFYLAGVLPRLAGEWCQRVAGPATLAFLWLFGGVLITCTLTEPDAHFYRYQQPLLPLFILFAVLGARQIGLRLGEWGERLWWGWRVFYGIWGVASAGFFAVAYGENCADIRHQQVAMAQVIERELPPGASVAINDAGIQKYLVNRYTVDLIGLTSPGLARAWRHGSGSLYEHLEGMAPPQRPSHFAIFPNWFSFEEARFLQPVYYNRVYEPSIVDAEAVLYRADWTLAGSGDSLRSPRLLQALGDRQVVDQIDVADLESEDRHGYRSETWEVGQGEANLVLFATYEGESNLAVIDGGRTVTRGERMRVRLRPGEPALMVMRTLAGSRQRFGVLCEGRQVGRVETVGGAGRNWTELVVAQIPGESLGTGEVEIETRAERGSAVVPFHYWFLQ